MLAKVARTVAREWVLTNASTIPGFQGAFYHGSIGWLADDATIAPTSDLDIMVVLNDPNPPVKPGKFSYRDVLLEVSYVSSEHLRSPEHVLGQADFAGSFRTPSVIADPTGHLTTLQAAIARDYAKRRWVERRCEHARDKIHNNFRALRAATRFPRSGHLLALRHRRDHPSPVDRRTGKPHRAPPLHRRARTPRPTTVTSISMNRCSISSAAHR